MVFPLRGTGNTEKLEDSVFLRGNLHVKKHSGKTIMPVGNWSLIGSEVERDQ